jgi:hypothetical protein
MIDGNLRDYIQTQSDLFFDVDGYRSVIIESLLSRIHARYINAEDFRLEFGLSEDFIDVFTFLFDSNNLDRIMAYGKKCFESRSLIGQMAMV